MRAGFHGHAVRVVCARPPCASHVKLGGSRHSARAEARRGLAVGSGDAAKTSTQDFFETEKNVLWGEQNKTSCFVVVVVNGPPGGHRDRYQSRYHHDYDHDSDCSADSRSRRRVP
jgi:hypothetical protein